METTRVDPPLLLTPMNSSSLSSITWFSAVTKASQIVKLMFAVCGNWRTRTEWFCALSSVRTWPGESATCGSCCQRRCYLCVVCGSPKSPLVALWRETWAHGWDYPAASLAWGAREGERRERRCQCTAVVVSVLRCISNSSELLAFERSNQENLAKSISMLKSSFITLMSWKSKNLPALWHYKTISYNYSFSITVSFHATGMY